MNRLEAGVRVISGGGIRTRTATSLRRKMVCPLPAIGTARTEVPDFLRYDVAVMAATLKRLARALAAMYCSAKRRISSAGISFARPQQYGVGALRIPCSTRLRMTSVLVRNMDAASL